MGGLLLSKIGVGARGAGEPANASEDGADAEVVARGGAGGVGGAGGQCFEGLGGRGETCGGVEGDVEPPGPRRGALADKACHGDEGFAGGDAGEEAVGDLGDGTQFVGDDFAVSGGKTLEFAVEAVVLDEDGAAGVDEELVGEEWPVVESCVVAGLDGVEDVGDGPFGLGGGESVVGLGVGEGFEGEEAVVRSGVGGDGIGACVGRESEGFEGEEVGVVDAGEGLGGGKEASALGVVVAGREEVDEVAGLLVGAEGDPALSDGRVWKSRDELVRIKDQAGVSEGVKRRLGVWFCPLCERVDWFGVA